MRVLALLAALVIPLHALGSSTPAEVILLVGAPGEKEYEQVFRDAAKDWQEAAAKANRKIELIDGERGTNQLEQLTRTIKSQPNDGSTELWLVLIGHGTFDGKEARFNLHGPDLTAQAMADLLDPFKRPLIILNTASASAPFLVKLSRPHRVLVSATRSGWEENYARFGKFLSRSLVDPAADLDKDGQVSVLEAFLSTGRQVEDFYRDEKRLATEHALIDDNGDGKGTPPSFFKGIRAVKKPSEAAEVDGLRAHQVHFVRSKDEETLSPETRARRNELELELDRLRGRQAQMAESAYLAELERILVQLAELYHKGGATNSPAPSLQR